MYVFGWYWHNVDNLGELIYQEVFRREAERRGIRVTFGDNVQTIQGEPVLIGGGELLTEPWANRIREIPLCSKCFAAHSVSGNCDAVVEHLNGARIVFGRDWPTVHACIKAGGNARFAPDCALLCRGEAARGRELVARCLDAEGLSPFHEYVLVAPLGYWVREKQMDILQLLKEILDLAGCPVVFFPASTRGPDDRSACYLLQEWSRVQSIVFPRYPYAATVQDAVDIVAGASGVIAARHSIALLAVANNVPVVGLANHKIPLSFEAIDRGHLIWRKDMPPSQVWDLLSMMPQPLSWELTLIEESLQMVFDWLQDV